MRALITFAFVVFLVVSALCLMVGAWFWPIGIAFLPFWFLTAVPFTGALCVVWLRDEKPRFSPSDIYFPKRNYKSWTARDGWPRAPIFFYECGICHKTLSSESEETMTCGCGNIFIGPDHIGAQDATKVRLFEQ